ncbi:VOC family protein [Nocardioides pacificus]
MSRMLFVNLPVRDVTASRAFWEGLDFAFNDDYSDGKAACLVLNEQACVMLLEQDFFHGFHQTARHTGDQAILCISARSRDEVEQLCERAFAAGATRAADVQDDGPMHGWSFRDPDGHIWEVLWMDAS